MTRGDLGQGRTTRESKRRREVQKDESCIRACPYKKLLVITSYYVILHLVLYCNSKIKLAEAKPKIARAACNNGAKKLVTPVLPPLPKKGKSPWLACCDDESSAMPGNLDVNYVWVIESMEKLYFFVTGMSMLLQSSIGMFRLVEPNVCENALSPIGFPLSQFMYFEAGSTEQMVPISTWQQKSHQTDDNSRVNVFYLDIYQLAENDRHVPCDIPMENSDKFCYQIIISRRGNRFQMIFPHNGQLGKQAFNRIFNLIRHSDAALKMGITPDTIITLGLYDQWHHLLYTSGMVAADDATYGKIHPSAYMQEAAKTILQENDAQRVSAGTVDTAISWRMQKQFFAAGKHIYGKIRSDLTFNADKGGFVVGCQLGHLVRSLNRKASDDSPVALFFDIFANKGQGSGRDVMDGIEVGPTKNVRKLVVRAMRKILKKVVIVEVMLQKMDANSLQRADPMGIVLKDRQTFITWVEVSIGSGARRLVHAGGHFAELLAEFRNGIEVTDVYQPSYCSNSSFHEDKLGQSDDDPLEKENDDLITILFSKDKKAIDNAGNNVFGLTQLPPSVPEVEFTDPTPAPVADPDADKKDIFGNYLPKFALNDTTTVDIVNDPHRKIPRSPRVSASEIDTAQIPTEDGRIAIKDAGDVTISQGGLVMIPTKPTLSHVTDEVTHVAAGQQVGQPAPKEILPDLGEVVS